jgi:short-subunit dehydrogenase
VLPYHLVNNNKLIIKIFNEAISYGNIKNLFFPIGVSIEDDNESLNLENIDVLLATNLITIIKLCNLFFKRIKDLEDSNIIFFSSIAAIRGRKNNIFYSASKRALESYFESIQHALGDSKVTVKLYCLGYVETSLSFGKKLLFPKITPDRVANEVIDGLNRSTGRKFLPKFWFFVERIIKVIPWFIYRRINF